jgi:hypothetical protein
MKTLNKILILLNGLVIVTIFTLTSCMTEEEKEAKRREIYFLNEDFILVDKKENVTSGNGTPIKIRTWIIHRVNNPYDSVYVGEISSRVVPEEPTSNCGCDGDFYITNELWYNKEIGDVLHFEFIRKNRFYKVQKNKLENIKLDNDLETIVISEQNIPEPTVTNLETDRRILEIEREILSLQRELETLKE